MTVSGQDGGIQTGCGTMAMVMVMFGGMGTIITGQDLMLIMEACTIPLIHFGVIMIPFMDTETCGVMAMEICGVMDTIHGTETFSIHRIGIHLFL